MRRKVNHILNKTGHFLYALVLTFVLLNWVFPFQFSVDYSKSVYAKDGELMSVYLNKSDKWRLHIPLKEVSPLFIKTLVLKEDKWFDYHYGFNPVSILKALFNNSVSGQRKGGASTITMQVVRLIKPQKRTYFNKLTELYRAVQLEYRFSKKEILEMYINLLPYGGNIEGVGSATYIFFGKAPHNLSLSECVALSIIPNKPSSLNIKKNQAAIQIAKNKWIKKISPFLNLSQSTIDDALMETFSIQYFPMPKIAPQFCNRLLVANSTFNKYYSTISYPYQIQVQLLLNQYVEKLKEKNINNGSLMIVDNKTGNVLVYCGSNDFNDAEHFGQVDGVKAVRSPGSTLKPFLYGLSFEKGLYTPETVVLDIPVNYGAYSPLNYDETFKGRVKIKDALVQSLNIPAVNLLNEIGVKSFKGFLKTSGFANLQNQNLGLSLALGGCGVTLEELTMAYSVFANEGVLKRKKFLKTAPNGPLNPVLSPAASYLVSSILQTVQRPDLPMQLFNSTFRIPKVAWKTGTSFGRKDAWAVGYNKQYTVGVWIGNFDGEGVASLNGGDMATPLLFEVFNAIDYNSKKQWFSEPKGISYRAVCNQSGYVPSDDCQQTMNEPFIEKQTVQKICQHSIRLKVNKDSSLYYCNSCLENNSYFEKQYPNLLAELINYYEQEKIVYKKWPQHNPSCQRVETYGELKIVSPTHQSEYLVEENSDSKMMLNASVDHQAKVIYWFVNDKLIRQTNPNQAIFVKMPIGKLKITCSDDLGRKQVVYITVKNF